MTMRNNLIDDLVQDAEPASPLRVRTGWAMIAVAVVIAVGAILLGLGVRDDIARMSPSGPLLWKFACSLVFAGAVTNLVLRSAQPQFRVRSLGLFPAIAAASAFVLPGILIWLTRGMPSPMLITWDTCLKSTTGLGLAMLGVMLFWLRNGAPTRAKQAGLLAGLASGAWASFAYSMHCGHDELFYAAIWYTLVTGLLGGLGWLLAPRLCRW